MKNTAIGSAYALAFTYAAFAATPVLAQNETGSTAIASDESEETLIVEASRPDGYGPAGMMGDHTHEKGGVMFGLTYMRENYRGSNLKGDDKISDEIIADTGFHARTKSMTMDMLMLHMMWAPSERLTLMAMPSWQRMDMTMVSVGSGEGGGHGGHGGSGAMPQGTTMSHATQGFGDTQVSALITLSRGKKHQLHAAVGASIPTGKVDRKNADGTFVHYGMQSGSGTWDILPQITYRQWNGKIGWGVQSGYVFRAEDENDSGFRFGDRFTASGWASYAASSKVSVSGRLAFQTEGKVEGHYDGAHNHGAPADRQANYGGDRVEAGIGSNILLGRYRIGAEATVPLYQRVNGIQAPKRFGASVNMSTMF